MTSILTALLFVATGWSGWSFNPVTWKADEAGSLVVNTYANEFAIAKTETLHQRILVMAKVTVQESLGDDWKTAGVSIYQDDKNFWHFAMVASPDKEEKRFFELSEMRDGKWLAQNNLKRVVDTKSGGPWKPGETYWLSILLYDKSIKGTAIDASGKTVREIEYEFTDVAVDRGKPALHCSHFKASFHDLAVKAHKPVQPSPTVFPPYASKSFLTGVDGKATGFFHVKSQRGKWFGIDPKGRGFLPLGVDHVKFQGHWCEKLGYSPYNKKNLEKYPDPKVWEAETLDRLAKWGFNMIAAGGSHSLYRRGFTHAINLSVGERFTRLGDEYAICEAKGIPCSAFPNVFHPDFAKFCEYQTRRCAANANDPWLFGYFLDNELRWWGKAGWNCTDAGLFDACMDQKTTHTAKLALIDFLRRRYQADIQKFNAAWKTSLEKFDDLLAMTEIEAKTDQATEDKAAFVEKAADLYFRITTKAIRKHDPNHMILGCRFAGGNASERVWQRAGKYCEVISFNYYGNVNLDHGVAMDHHSPWTGKTLREAFEKFYEMGRRPMLVTEWSFPALDAGLPSVHGAGQRFRTQAERTEATRIFAEEMLRMPFILGYDYFMWVDEPALGISEKFPEDSNYGLVNEDGKPYSLLTEMFTKLHQDASRLRQEGFTRPPVSTPLKIQKIAGTLKPAPIQFQQDGDRYQVIARRWKLAGKLGPGPFWSDVSFGDRHETRLGWFTGMVEHEKTRLHWDAVQQITKVKPIQAPLTKATTAVELIGRSTDGSGPRFEMAQRFTFYPDQDAFAVEMLWCKNLSAEPLRVKRFYFRPHSDIGGDGKNDVPIKDEAGAPRVWGAPSGDAWFDTDRKIYWGLAGLQDQPVKFYFWLNEQGGQHPDARWEADITIAPGETYRPASPMKVLSTAGKGTRPEWELKTEKALKQIGL